jgi:hypothetical protein
VNRWHARLKRLEDAAQPWPWNWNAEGIEQCARKKLSPAEADLLDQATALIRSGRQSEWSEAHRAAWDRWEAALATAAEEFGFPYLDAIDRLA